MRWGKRAAAAAVFWANKADFNLCKIARVWIAGGKDIKERGEGETVVRLWRRRVRCRLYKIFCWLPYDGLSSACLFVTAERLSPSLFLSQYTYFYIFMACYTRTCVKWLHPYWTFANLLYVNKNSIYLATRQQNWTF